MNEETRGLKALGLLLLLTLSLTAFTAAAAQAGEFKIEGNTFTAKGIASETVEGAPAAGKLLVPGLGITLACEGSKVTATALLGGVAHATVLFTGCTVEGNAFCKPFETKAKMETNLPADRGFIIASGLGELVLMGGEHFLLVASGVTPFATIYLTKSTQGCTLPLENTVTGSTVFALLTALSSQSNQGSNTIPEATLKSLWAADVLAYGGQTAWLDGGLAALKLSGANTGKFWSAE